MGVDCFICEGFDQSVSQKPQPDLLAYYANRLKGKNYHGDIDYCPADPGTYTVAFTYDTGTTGIGRRTKHMEPDAIHRPLCLNYVVFEYSGCAVYLLHGRSNFSDETLYPPIST
jgi:hypothetical protein